MASSCQAPEFYERQNLALAVMRLEPPPGAAHFRSKVFQATEGAAGGIGAGAGGGCGCY